MPLRAAKPASKVCAPVPDWRTRPVPWEAPRLMAQMVCLRSCPNSLAAAPALPTEAKVADSIQPLEPASAQATPSLLAMS